MSVIDPAQNPKVERRIREFLKTLNSGGVAIDSMTPQAARAFLLQAQTSAKIELPPADIENKTIEQSGMKINLTIVRPVGAVGVIPAFLYIHGGGWVVGDFPTHERLVRDLVADSGYTAIFVNYSLSPEARYPTAINEIYAAVEWVSAHAAELRIDASKLGIAGNSVGGNMTAAICLMALHRGGPKFKCQIMLWPVTDANFETESYLDYAEGYFLTRSTMQWGWDAYIPGAESAQRKEIYAAPLQAGTDQLKGLPAALIQVAGNDILRDEGIAYARKLDEAGVNVTVVHYENLIHDYGMLNAITSVPAIRDALHQAAEFLRKYLG